MSSRKLLEEDQIKMYNKWVRGIATREQKPSHVTVGDLLQASGRNENDRAPLELPYPMTHIVEDLGGLYLAADNVQANTFGTSSQNAYGARTVGTGNPTGGSNGDIYYKY